jgi:hypothetical protein
MARSDGDPARKKGVRTGLPAKDRWKAALRKFFRGNRDFYAHGRDYR